MKLFGLLAGAALVMLVSASAFAADEAGALRANPQQVEGFNVPAPPGGVPVTQFKLLVPDDWEAFLKSRTEFQREWDHMTGLR